MIRAKTGCRWAWSLTISAGLATATMAAPRVAKTIPTDGASDLDPTTKQIVVTFDSAMKTDTYSVVQVEAGEFPELIGDEPIAFKDDKTLVIVVKLAPGKSYALGLNSAKRMGLKAADGAPLAPTVIRFKTAGGAARPAKRELGYVDDEKPAAPKPSEKQDQTAPESPPAKPSGTVGPPSVPQGWLLMDDKLLGTQVAIPPGWTPRIRGSVALCIDPDQVQKAGAFFVPILVGANARPDGLADGFDEMLRRSLPDLQTQAQGRPTAECVQRDLTATIQGTRLVGTYRSVVSRSGMGFIMGYLGPADRIDALRPTFYQILASYRYTGPKMRLQPFKSAAVELKIPPGWQVQTSEGDGTADQDIDWVVGCPQMPGVRVFMFTPKYCSSNWVMDGFNANVDQMQLAMWRNKGYEVANFSSDQQVLQTALKAVMPELQVTREQPIEELRNLFLRLSSAVLQMSQQTGGRFDVYVFEIQGRRNVQGVDLRSAIFVGASALITNAGIKGAMGLWSVQVRGYEAPAAQFAQLVPLMDRVCTSFSYTLWWIKEVQKANDQQAKQIREFWAYMNKVDREIWDNRMRTNSAINEMMYDSLIAGTPGYVNKETGTIEKIPTDNVDGFKDEYGRVVSPEEVIDKKIDPRWATRLREANADDYMKYDRRVQVWP